jgi:hypothetical protein
MSLGNIAGLEVFERRRINTFDHLVSVLSSPCSDNAVAPIKPKTMPFQDWQAEAKLPHGTGFLHDTNKRATYPVVALGFLSQSLRTPAAARD